MAHSLGPVDASSLVTAWSVQPLAVAVAVAAAAAYTLGARRVSGWARRRSTVFGAGIALLVWTTCGWPQAYGRTLFWVWTTQQLFLLLVVPMLIMAGQPLALARLRGHRLPRLGLLSSPLVGPALVPLVSAVLFFGPVPGWSIGVPVVVWLVQVAVLVVGAAIALPLVESDVVVSSLAVGLSLAIGMVELLVDAVPGIVLRLQTGVVTSYFDHRTSAGAGAPAALRPLADQQRAGAVLWAVAEILDLPFLILVFRRWLRADAQEARVVDTVLDAEEIARAPEAADGTASAAPWWLSDPQLRGRYKS